MRISDWSSDVCSSDLAEIPLEWLKAVADKYLTPEEMEKVKSLGSWEEIMEKLKKRLEEQQGRHQGGYKWVGTGGTSPFANTGNNPEGGRNGGESRHKHEKQEWDKRDFANPAKKRELGR